MTFDIRAIVLLAAAYLLAAGCGSARLPRSASACEGSPPDTRPDRVTRVSGAPDLRARGEMQGGLTVQLTDIDSKRPVEQATVHLWAGDRMLAPAEEAAMDTDGVHVFQSIPAGYYVVRAGRIGYTTQVIAQEIRPGLHDTLKIAWQMRALCIVE